MSEKIGISSLPDFLLLGDTYDRKARLAPGLIVTLPIVVALTFIAGATELKAWYEVLSIGLLSQVSLMVVFGYVAHSLGSGIEYRHMTDPHGPLLTFVCSGVPNAGGPVSPVHGSERRHSDALKEAWSAAIKDTTGQPLCGSIRADDSFDAYKRLIVKLCSDPEKKCMAAAHGEEYGFARNLVVMSPYWMAFSAFGLVAVTYVMAFEGVRSAIIGVVFEAMFFLASIIVYRSGREFMNTTGERFVESLLNAAMLSQQEEESEKASESKKKSEASNAAEETEAAEKVASTPTPASHGGLAIALKRGRKRSKDAAERLKRSPGLSGPDEEAETPAPLPVASDAKCQWYCAWPYTPAMEALPNRLGLVLAISLFALAFAHGYPTSVAYQAEAEARSEIASQTLLPEERIRTIRIDSDDAIAEKKRIETLTSAENTDTLLEMLTECDDYYSRYYFSYRCTSETTCSPSSQGMIAVYKRSRFDAAWQTDLYSHETTPAADSVDTTAAAAVGESATLP